MSQFIVYARRMTTAQRDSVTPGDGALVLDTDERALYLGDGATMGGVHSNALKTKTISSDYTLTRADLGHLIYVDTSAGDVTLTLPNSTTEPKMASSGFNCGLTNTGANSVLFANEAGVTLDAANGYTSLTTQHAGSSIHCKADDNYHAWGLDA